MTSKNQKELWPLATKEQKMEAQQFGETHSEDELSKMEKGYIHASTDKNSQWAARTLSQWLKQQNANATGN